MARRIVSLPARAANAEDSLLAHSVRAHAMLAQGDPSGATVLMRDLLAAARTSVAQEWDEALSMAAERLTLAEVMVARRQFEHRHPRCVRFALDRTLGIGNRKPRPAGRGGRRGR